MYFKFGLRLTIICFVIATVMMTWYYLTMSTQVAYLAFQFTMIAIVLNWLFAGFLLYLLLRQKISMQQLLKTIGVMLINIPVGIVYAQLMAFLLDYARISISNESSDVITSVELKGCEPVTIGSIPSGESKTTWIKLDDPCNIMIEYQKVGRSTTDSVITHIGPGKGLTSTYIIR